MSILFVPIRQIVLLDIFSNTKNTQHTKTINTLFASSQNLKDGKSLDETSLLNNQSVKNVFAK